MGNLEEIGEKQRELYQSYLVTQDTIDLVERSMAEDPPGPRPHRSALGGIRYVEDPFDPGVHRRRERIRSDYLAKRDKILGQAAVFYTENPDALVEIAAQDYEEFKSRRAA